MLDAFSLERCHIVLWKVLKSRRFATAELWSVPNQQRHLNKFQVRSEKFAPSFLEQYLCQILLISADLAYDLVPNMDKDLYKLYVVSTILLSFYFTSHPCWLGM